MRMTSTLAKDSARIFCLWFVFLLLIASPLPAQQSAVEPPPTVVFMTDFGVADDSVALCKGVMYGIAPHLRIVDLTHQVNAFSIRDGARFLFGATPYFPAGTVFVAVVDPGVGSSRRAVVAKSKRGQFFVLPDNGLMTMVEDHDGIEGIREITNPDWMVGAKISSTFHGRDIFSPVGAHIARGDDWTQVGPVVKELVRLDLKPASVDDKWPFEFRYAATFHGGDQLRSARVARPRQVWLGLAVELDCQPAKRPPDSHRNCLR